jgi:hypothetical protein
VTLLDNTLFNSDDEEELGFTICRPEKKKARREYILRTLSMKYPYLVAGLSYSLCYAIISNLFFLRVPLNPINFYSLISGALCVIKSLLHTFESKKAQIKRTLSPPVAEIEKAVFRGTEGTQCVWGCLTDFHGSKL